MDILTADGLYHLNNIKIQSEPTHPNNNPSSIPEDFQKLLADKSFEPISCDKATKNGGVVPRLNQTILPPYMIDPIPSSPSQSINEQLRIYKEDQLLAHPGGDYMDLKAEEPRIEQDKHQGFFGSIVKDFKDALSNVGNFFKDLLWGSEYRYIDDAGQVQTGQRKGLLGNIVAFFKNVVSSLSFGHYRPDGDPEPQGILERAQFACKKMINGAIMDDLIFGIPSSMINLLDDKALALWNLMEVVPDATIGNIPKGRRLVTTMFDNGQVMIDYITDCLPTGDAWMRVHAGQFNNSDITPPVLFNLNLPERYSQDSRWSTVRNTPLRKSIETIGSLLADIGVATATYHAIRTSKRRD